MRFLNKVLRAPCVQVPMALCLYAVNSSVFAAGFATAQTEATAIKTGIFGVVGVLALIYLLYLGVMAFSEKKSWSDFGWGVFYVSIVGASLTMGTWAWTLFA